MIDERALGEPEAPTQPDPEPTVGDPGTFDFASFLAGTRPVERRIRVYARGDLAARADELAKLIEDAGERWDAATDDTARAAVRGEYERLLDEYQSLRDEWEASGIWWTVTAKSSEWVEHMRVEYCKRHDLDPDKPMDTEHTNRLVMELLAAQTTSPSGVTADGLAQWRDKDPFTVDQIAAAVNLANERSASEAFGLHAGFSRRLSTSPGGRAS